MVSLDELVAADDVYRRVERLISWEAVRAAAGPFYAGDGRPSVCPAVVMKLFLAAAIEGIGSMRETLRVAERDLAIRRFLGYGLTERLPSHATVSYAQCVRFANSSIFEQLFTQVLACCRDAGLLDGRRLVVDATHVEANAALKSLRAELSVVAGEGDGSASAEAPDDGVESASAEASSEGVARTPGDPRPALALAEPRSGPTPRRRASNATAVSVSDPDAKLRHKPGQRPHLVHRAQVATDPKARVIVAVQAEPATGHEGSALEALAGRARWARLVAPATRTSLVDQHAGDLDAVASMKVVEAHHGGQHPVDRRRSPPRLGPSQQHHVVGRLAQPRHEQPELLERQAIPRQPAGGQELPKRLEVLGVGAHRVRRALNPRQPREIALQRRHRPPVGADHRPRLAPRPRRDHPLHPHHPPPTGRGPADPTGRGPAAARRVQLPSATLRVAPASRTRTSTTSSTRPNVSARPDRTTSRTATSTTRRAQLDLTGPDRLELHRCQPPPDRRPLTRARSTVRRRPGPIAIRTRVRYARWHGVRDGTTAGAQRAAGTPPGAGPADELRAELADVHDIDQALTALIGDGLVTRLGELVGASWIAASTDRRLTD